VRPRDERATWDAHWAHYAEAARQNPAQALRRELIFSELALGGGAGPIRLLDVGSGSGDFAAEAVARVPGAAVLGVELSAGAVARARATVPSARFVQADLLYDEPAEPGWATHAVCSEVLEHVDDPLRLLRQARRWLAPGARLVLTVPGGPITAFDVHLGHRRHFTTRALRQLLLEAGFEVERVAAEGFPFFNLYRSVVWLRGRGLVNEALAPSALARAVMGAFGLLFRLRLPQTRWGWQLLARARAPAAAATR
jgi:SAM-dependent methyltransferase